MIGLGSQPRCVRVALAGCAALLLGGCASIPTAGLNGVVVRAHSPFIIAQSTNVTGWGYFSHPYVYRYPDGTLLARYFLHGDWKKPATRELLESGTATAPSPTGPWTAGRGHLTELQRFGPYYLGGVVALSNSLLFIEGTESLRVAASNGQILCRTGVTYRIKSQQPIYVSKQGVLAGDGAIVFAAWRMISPGQWETFLIKSTDGGASFDETGVIATYEDIVDWKADAPLGYEGPNEPALIAMPDGELLCVCRVGTLVDNAWIPPRGGRRLLVARSKDFGATWTRERAKPRGVCPKLYRMSSGILVLAVGREGNVLYFSVDNGHSWCAEVSLSPLNAKTSGYCDVVEVSPGRLLAVYDLHDTDLGGIWLWEPKSANGVMGRLIDVGRLW